VALNNGKAESVGIRNVPFFLYKAGIGLDVPDIGHVKLDIAYGGDFYAILEADSVGMEVTSENANEIII
jgi:proline racemase